MAKVELKLRCHNLPSVDTFSKSDPIVVVWQQREGKVDEVGRTECLKNNNEPTFTKTFSLDCDLKLELKFEVSDLDGAKKQEALDTSNARLIGYYTTTLADLVVVGETGNKRLRTKNGNLLKNGSIHITATLVGDTAVVAAAKEEAKTLVVQVARSKATILTVNPLAGPSLAVWALVQAELADKVEVKQVEGSSPEDFLYPTLTGAPNLSDAGFSVGDPHSILRYLCEKYQLEAHWFPGEPQARVRVDEALDQLSSRVRRGSPFFYKYFAAQDNKAAIAKGQEWCQLALQWLDGVLAKQAFVAGEQISVADLAYLAEFDILQTSKDAALGKFKNVARWLKAMSETAWYGSVFDRQHKHK